MPSSNKENPWIGQTRKGLLEYVVLAVLEGGEDYGYSILQKVRAFPSFATVTESAVYPILGRLVKEAIISAHSLKQESGPPRKYFQLEAGGRVKLALMRRYLHMLQSDLSTLLPTDNGSK